MILDADENLLEECVRRSHGRTTAAHWRTRLESTVSFVEVISNTPDITGNIELGRLPYLPSFGFVMVDPDTEHGVIIVELYHHRSAEDNPTFELYADRDGEWYRFFRQQFQAMWGSCQVEQFHNEGGQNGQDATGHGVTPIQPGYTETGAIGGHFGRTLPTRQD